MDDQYQPIYKQAVDLQYKFHDLIDQPNHPMAVTLRREVQDLVSDVKTSKNPRDLENRVKNIQRQLIEARAQGDHLMSAEHVDYFHHNYEQMRTSIRGFHNYS